MTVSAGRVASVRLAGVRNWAIGLLMLMAVGLAVPSNTWATSITYDITSASGSSGLFYNEPFHLGAGSSITISGGQVISSDIIIDETGVSSPVATFTSTPSWETIPGYPSGFFWVDTANDDIFGIAGASNLFSSFTGCTGCLSGFFDGLTLEGNVNIVAAPASEPAILVLLVSGLIALAVFKFRREQLA